MSTYLTSVLKQFEYYKKLGEKTFDQLSVEALRLQPNEHSNSISIITKHIIGNMLSRWTNFLTEDGEKPWRKRDDEFIDDFTSKAQLLSRWNKAWDVLFEAIKSIKEKDLERIIYIRNQGHTVTEAINRQLAHYAYHVGQIVYLGVLIKKQDWKSLSIPKGESLSYNKEKFSKEKERKHFTDDL